MALTRSEIIQEAMDRIGLNPLETDLFETAKVNRAFNALYRDTAERIRCLSSEAVVNLVANQQDYDLTAGANPVAPRGFEVRAVRILTGAGSLKEGLIYKSFDELPTDRGIDRGNPDYWSTRGTMQVILWPTPSTSITGGLLVDTFNHPIPLAITTVPDGLVITDASNASPVVLTVTLPSGVTSHGYQDGQWVQVSGVLGNTAANGRFQVASLSATTFSLVGSTGNSAYTSGGTVVAQLELPEHHREVLILGMAAKLCELNKYDETLLAQFGAYLALWDNAVQDKIAKEADPGSRPIQWNRKRRRSGGSWDRDLSRLPTNYTH